LHYEQINVRNPRSCLQAKLASIGAQSLELLNEQQMGGDGRRLSAGPSGLWDQFGGGELLS
jgi:hypothetical protein